MGENNNRNQCFLPAIPFISFCRGSATEASSHLYDQASQHLHYGLWKEGCLSVLVLHQRLPVEIGKVTHIYSKIRKSSLYRARQGEIASDSR